MLSFQRSLLFVLILLWHSCVLELVLYRYKCRLPPEELRMGQLARHSEMVNICQLLSLPGTLLTFRAYAGAVLQYVSILSLSYCER